MRFKILVVDCLIKYLNPSRTSYPNLFTKIGDVSFYGPGYCSVEVLKKGLDQYIIDNKGFDFIIFTEQTFPEVFWNEISNRFNLTLKKFYDDCFEYNFEYSKLKGFWESIGDYLNKHDNIVKIQMLCSYDYNSMSKNLYEYLDINFKYFIGVGPELLNESKFKNYKGWEYELNNNGIKLITKKNVICCPHWINDYELCFKSLDCRKSLISVLGVSYSSRRKIKKVLKKHNIKYEDGKNALHFINYISYKLFNRKVFNQSIEKNNASFRNALFESVYSYTCGSEVRQAIRKFFEIPAARSILICEKFIGFEDLGFIDMVNCVLVNEYDIIDKINYLQNNIELRNTISSNGFKLIKKNHSIDSRALQIRSSLVEIIKNNFSSSYWSEGLYVNN